ncbi:MAG: PTS mannitol transporter subunit IICBA [Clostridiales Family XIII bacterium]|jgi:PTS system mannitol-specific IIC component|nr:PTS mannitol transporter subunit IICBA [Clostridiales Family XIII bacterium]
MKQGVQRVGRFMSGMVMPNIGAFIAWGLITALFIATGWAPNEKLATLVDPMLKYLLPLLIGYTGGKVVGGARGGVVGAIATIGVIVGADIPMFLGAMAAGPLGGLLIKKVDKFLDSKIPAGFEMLINNFSAGILGGLLAVLCFLGIGPAATWLNELLGSGVGWLVDRNLLPLTSIIVEPAKILFLNNAINHGVFTPMGMEQASEIGKSIFFMIESNPGPGLGLLLAYCFFGKGSAKASAPGAIIIHFFGGIHEIYFPYVLMNPVLIIAMIGGGMTGVATLSILHGGLVAAASPGSIIAEMAMTPRGGFLANIIAILLAASVSFVLSCILLKIFGKADVDLESEKEKTASMKAQAKGLEHVAAASSRTITATSGSSAIAATTIETTIPQNVHKIIFACDAGMGSSAMGATKLKKKIRTAGLEDIDVAHAPVSEIPFDAEIVVVHQDLLERAKTRRPDAYFVPITNFLTAPEYDKLVEDLKK